MSTAGTTAAASLPGSAAGGRPVGFLARAVTTVTQRGATVVVGLDAVSYTQLELVPGFVTGETFAEQGLETILPNFPALSLPELQRRPLELRITAVAPDTVRLVVAAPGHPALSGDGTELGIVVHPRPAPAVLQVTETAEEVALATSAVRVVIRRRPFGFAVYHTGRRPVVQTAELLRQCIGAPLAPAVASRGDGIALALQLAPAEDIAGFGEQFSGLVKNGQALTLTPRDALGPGTGLAYKPAPVWHSSRGYTGFVNTGADVRVDIGSSLPPVFSIDVDEGVLDLYLIVGPDPKTRLSRYTELTGRMPGVPPLWAFGLWMSRCRYATRDQLEGVAAAMRAHEVPCDVLHVDPDWLELDRLNCDWRWSERKFPDPPGMFTRLAEAGYHVSLWELPYLDRASPLFEEARRGGDLVTGPDGTPASVARTPAPDGRPRGLVDFSRAETRRWWQDKHRPLLEMGAAVFTTDFGEGLPDDCWQPTSGQDRARHNLYPLLYNGTVSDGIARLTGRAPLVWGRSGWAGSQRYPAQWAGDSESTVAGMAATLRGGLSAALSAPGLWSHDIGGFFGPELTPALYVRWAQFGCLSPLTRAHGLRAREPWTFGEQALEIVRRWVQLRYQLLPYLYSVTTEAVEHGWPVLRPMWLEHPDDPTARRTEDQFLLGADLLVAPIFDDTDEPVDRQIYLPAGGWADFVTGDTATGPCHLRRQVPLHEMPLFVRSGAAIPTVTPAAHTGLIDRDRVQLRIYGDANRTTRITHLDEQAYRVHWSGGPSIAVTGDAPADLSAVHAAAGGHTSLAVNRAARAGN